ncbi:MAG: LysR family transcriptional regulator [Parvibaculaceae bacterium]
MMDKADHQKLLAIGSRALHYFVVVADVKSFSKAAQTLGISQPALSKQIRHLETHLNTEILRRHWRGVDLTEDGKRLYDQVVYLEKGFLDLSNDLGARAHTLTGKIALSVTPSSIRTILEVLSKFKRENPDVTYVVREGYSDSARSLLEMGHVDIAIFPTYNVTEIARTDLKIIPILTEPACIVGAKFETAKKALTFEEVVRMPLILPCRGNGLRTLVDSIAAGKGLAVRCVIETDGADLLKAFALNGMGYSFLPANAVAEEIRRGELRALPIVAPEVRRTFVAAVHARRGLSKAAQTLFSRIVKELGNAAMAGRWTNARSAMSDASDTVNSDKPNTRGRRG